MKKTKNHNQLKQLNRMEYNGTNSTYICLHYFNMSIKNLFTVLIMRSLRLCGEVILQKIIHIYIYNIYIYIYIYVYVYVL